MRNTMSKKKDNGKKITATKITELLGQRHKDDLFVSQCKNGESYGRKLLKLDGWALVRTWSPVTTIGYEIKVDRRDFEKDQKWPGYVPYVHRFYFVCPPGLIKAHELPKGIGLVWTTMAGDKLLTKVRAAPQEPDPVKMTSLMLYVLMSRTVVVPDMFWANQKKIPSQGDRLEEVRQAVEQAEARKELAWVVNQHIRSRFADMQQEVHDARMMKQDVDRFVDELKMVGIEWDPTGRCWSETNRVLTEIRRLRKVITENTLRSMTDTGQSLVDLAKEIRELRKKERKEQKE